MTADEPILTLEGIRKTFGAVLAVEDMSLDLHAGEIVALVGDNGAGKSTLIKIISGVHRQTSGLMQLDGRPVAFPNASSARSMGIEVVYQDLALGRSATGLHEPVPWAGTHQGTPWPA